MSPDSLISSFKREVIYRRPQEFKIPALRDIAHLFPKGTCPFVAGWPICYVGYVTLVIAVQVLGIGTLILNRILLLAFRQR